MDADRHVHPRPAARSTPQRLKIESTGRTPLLAAWRHHTPDRPSPCRRCRHRGDHPVKVATNATIFVFIESDGVIAIFSAGQQSSRDYAGLYSRRSTIGLLRSWCSAFAPARTARSASGSTTITSM